MSKIRSGILGNLRGTVSGVVGSQWKDVNYLREYVKPANPNSSAQQVQRSKMSDCVSFAKSLVGPVFNAYTDKFQKSMSGFNRFIKTNIGEFDGSPNYFSLVLTDGPLYQLQSVQATYNTADGETIIVWDEAIGNNGALTDAVYAAIYTTGTGFWFFPVAEETRDDETMTLTLPTGYTANTIEVWAWAAKKTGSIVDLIAHSSNAQCAAP